MKIQESSIESKGQIISKVLFGIINSPKKTNKKNRLNYYDTSVDMFSFVFWEKLKPSKRHFGIN